MKNLLTSSSVKALFVATLLFPAGFIGSAQAQNASQDRYEDKAEDSITQAELEQILAPIALYPDSILSHILVAATYPVEVVQAERWLQQNSELEGQEAVEASEREDWDPSVKALLAFPQILKRMSQDLDWTQKLGNAFLQDEEFVLTSVQNLRELAQEAGSLDEMEKVTVTRDRQSIIIEPREREIVYVPYYDTRVVYGSWPWRHYQPIYWDYPYVSGSYYGDYYSYHPHQSFYWGPRISLSFGFFSNTFHWRNRHIVRISPWHYRPHRYYGHYDILGHRHAQRWVHNDRRRHGNRSNRVDRVVPNDAVTRSQQIQRERTREDLYQSRVRDQLRSQRNTVVRTRPSQRVVTSQSRSQTSTAAPNTVTSNSRVALPRRDRGFEDNRRVVDRSVTRTVNRQVTVKPSQPATRSTPTQQRVVRSTNQTVNRTVSPPKPAATQPKPASGKPSTNSRTPRRQPR